MAKPLYICMYGKPRYVILMQDSLFRCCPWYYVNGWVFHRPTHWLVSERDYCEAPCWPCIKSECQKVLLCPKLHKCHLAPPPPPPTKWKFGSFKSSWTSEFQVQLCPPPPGNENLELSVRFAEGRFTASERPKSVSLYRLPSSSLVC